MLVSCNAVHPVTHIIGSRPTLDVGMHQNVHESMTHTASFHLERAYC